MTCCSNRNTENAVLAKEYFALHSLDANSLCNKSILFYFFYVTDCVVFFQKIIFFSLMIHFRLVEIANSEYTIVFLFLFFIAFEYIIFPVEKSLNL